MAEKSSQVNLSSHEVIRSTRATSEIAIGMLNLRRSQRQSRLRLRRPIGNLHPHPVDSLVRLVSQQQRSRRCHRRRRLGLLLFESVAQVLGQGTESRHHRQYHHPLCLRAAVGAAVGAEIGVEVEAETVAEIEGGAEVGAAGVALDYVQAFQYRRHRRRHRHPRRHLAQKIQ